MANVREYIRINPIDIDSRRAIGVIFPFNAEGVFFSSFTTAEQVKSNLLNVILTEPGERILNPRFGVGLRTYLFENFTDINDLEERIRNQIEIYVPDVLLNNVSINKEIDSHEIRISIFYTVISNNNQDAIQVNFTSDSGLSTSTEASPNASSVSSGISAGSTGGGSSVGGSSGGGGY